MSATYLVTGGCGFIGSHLADALLERGHAVRILDDLSTGKAENVPAAATLIRGDVADPEIVRAAMNGVEGCFHLAAIASVERSKLDWRGTHRTNLTGAVTIFEAAARAGISNAVPVIYASSAAVYGDNKNLPLSENAIARPLSAYGADKLGCEHHARVASEVHGVPTTGLRFFNVFGPRQDPKSPYSGVISIFCERLTAQKPVTIFGDGEQTRDFIYVGDVVRALLIAMQRVTPDPQVFNVCTGRATPILGLAHAIAGLCGGAASIELQPPRTGDIRHSLGNPERARAKLEFSADTALPEGLGRLLAARTRDARRG